MAEITAGRLREILAYDQGTGVFRWRLAKGSRAEKFAIAGHTQANGYMTIRLDKKLYFVHRLAWFWSYGEWPPVGIDHIDGDPRNNRLSNLRLADQGQNLANARRKSTNTSGRKGVHWHTKLKKWRVRITKDYRSIHVGLFDDIEQAAAAYDQAARQLFGQFARGD